MESNLLVVISGPSGVGKGTIVNEVVRRLGEKKVYLSVSATTRAPRAGEVHGKHYFFMSREEFQKMLLGDGFLESARNYENYYGTPKKNVLDNLNRGKDVILEIDINGGMQVKEKYPKAVMIFILPPSVEELQSRLKKRNSESQKSFEIRTNAAAGEIKKYKFYDYAVLNDSLDRAVCDIMSILKSEKLKSERQKERLRNILQGDDFK